MKQLISLLTLLWFVSASAAFAEARGDYLIAVQGQDRWIPFSELLGNDDGFHQADLSVAQSPNFGSLVVSPAGLTYVPPTTPLEIYSSDRFTYTVETRTGDPEQAEVTIRLLPRHVPVVGDFHGDEGLELGFYRPAHSDFKICPLLVGLADSHCSRFQVSGHPPGLPMVGSWHDARYDEMALYDPVSGTISVFGPLISHQSELSAAATLNGPVNAWPVPGINDSDFVFWRAEEHRFLLIRPDASKTSYFMQVSDLLEEDRWRPVTRRGHRLFGLANLEAGETTWLEPRVPGGGDGLIGLDGAGTEIFLWFQDVRQKDFWAYFNTLETWFRVALDYHEGLTILVDIPDDPD